MERLSELWAYLRVRKRFWLLPLLLVLAVLAVLLVMGESAAVSPFLYTLF